MYTARYLGAAGFGILSFALAGLSTLTVREVARDKSLAGEYLGNVAMMKMTYEKYKTFSRRLSQQKITKLTVVCNNCNWRFE